ncbi:hypothetical protein Tco_0367178 [Tanacetum coccineum]
MVDIPDDVDLVDYDGDDEENPKEDPKEDPEEELEPNNGLVNPTVPTCDPHLPVFRLVLEGMMVGESSSTHDSSLYWWIGHLGFGGVIWRTFILRARLREAELSTNQAEIALLKSKNKIGKKERELLDHDLGDVERTLGNVLERLKVLESGENATLKKRLTETKTKRSINMEMVRIGAVPKPPSDDEGTERPRKKSKKSSFDGAKGPSEPRGPPSDS